MACTICGIEASFHDKAHCDKIRKARADESQSANSEPGAATPDKSTPPVPIPESVLRGEASRRPQAVKSLPSADQVPPELLELPRWLGWRRQGTDKKPCCPITGEERGWPDKAVSFAEARAGAQNLKLDGIGFNPKPDDHIVFIDLDDCLVNGVLDEIVGHILQFFPHTYIEITPSGEGLRIIVKGTLPRNVVNHPLPGSKCQASTELYSGSSNHFVTITGNRYQDRPLQLATEVQGGIDWLLQYIGFDAASEEASGQTTEADALRYFDRTVAEAEQLRQGRYSFLVRHCWWLGRILGAKPKHPALTLENVEQKITQAIQKTGWKELRHIGGQLRAGMRKPVTLVDPATQQQKILEEADALIRDKDKPRPPLGELAASLAVIDIEEYKQRRRALARRLDISVNDLDEAVYSRRRQDENSELELIPFKIYEPWPEPVSGSDMANKIASTFRRFMIFKHEHDADVMALWALGSHLYDEFNIFPRLGLTSPLPECGKTTGLDVLEFFALRSTRSDNLTTSVAFRIMELHPSLLLDELDTFIHDNPELTGILNSGHKKGGYVFRMDKVNDRQVLTRFPTYGPVAYGMIGHPTGTLFSRTLFIRLERKSTTQKTEDFNVNENPALVEELTTLHRQIIRWATDHRDKVRECQPDTASLANRARDNWRPLLKIAHVLGGSWSARVIEAAGVTPPRAKKTEQEKLLRDIRNILHTRDVDRISSKLLLDDLVRQHESGWYRYHNKREPLDAGDLADLLSDFDIEPRSISANEETQLKLFGKVRDKRLVFKGYKRDLLEPLFEKYLTGEPEEVEVSIGQAQF